MKLDNVWVVDECQGLKDVLHVLLLSAEPLGRGELGLVPDDLDALLGVHGQVGLVNPGDIAVTDHIATFVVPSVF